MVGVSLALQLAAVLPEDVSICLVEGYPLPEPVAGGKPDYHPSFDARSTALSYSSRLIYEKTGLWNDLQQWLCPIETIVVTAAIPITTPKIVKLARILFLRRARNAIRAVRKMSMVQRITSSPHGSPVPFRR